MNASHREILVALLDELESIAREHEELTDTDVREAIHVTLNLHFVWGHPHLRFPQRFGMFSEEADMRIAAALTKFLDGAQRIGLFEAISPGQERLDFLQSQDVVASGGMRFDELIGHRRTPLPPEPLPAALYKGSE
jgi:hypothetical protein